MSKDLEVSFAMTEEEKERIKKILLGAGGLRHYLLKLTDGTELDVVNYESYKKLEEELNAHSKGLCEAVNDKNKLQERIDKALEIAYQYAQIDGSHHRLWVIDQMLRELLGDKYKSWIKKYEEGDYKWDIGIAP